MNAAAVTNLRPAPLTRWGRRARLSAEGKVNTQIPVNKKTGKWIGVLIGVALLVVLAFIEHKPSLPGKEEEGHHILSTAFWYDMVTSAPDQAKYVAVITVGSDMPANFPFESSGTDKKSTTPNTTTAGPGSLEEA